MTNIYWLVNYFSFVVNMQSLLFCLFACLSVHGCDASCSQDCIRLYKEYMKQFQKMKEKLQKTPDENVDFSEMYIFGKFDTFCKRLNKVTCRKGEFEVAPEKCLWHKSLQREKCIKWLWDSYVLARNTERLGFWVHCISVWFCIVLLFCFLFVIWHVASRLFVLRHDIFFIRQTINASIMSGWRTCLFWALCSLWS